MQSTFTDSPADCRFLALAYLLIQFNELKFYGIFQFYIPCELTLTMYGDNAVLAYTQSFAFILPVLWLFYFMAVRHGRSINARKHSKRPSIPYAIPARRSGLFVHVASRHSPDSVVMFQRPTYSLSAALPVMDILQTLPGGAQVDELEPPGLIASLPTLALFDQYIFSGSRSFAVVDSLYSRKGYAYLTDWLTDFKIHRVKYWKKVPTVFDFKS